MVSTTNAFSSFSVNDLDAARAFYADVVGVEVDQTPMGLDLRLGSGGHVFVYPKKNHVAASFTVLNFGVDDVEAAVDELAAKGVEFERYVGFDQDDKGIARGPEGPAIAWFKDPARNVLAILSNL
ncbi:VOC family protein [Oerskovia sp. USHLN155]|uniref:VOC family protein n=1 Tax=Oerskovia sp. USHLN155 TaxID=3081288 RepID=UPI00301A74CC